MTTYTVFSYHDSSVIRGRGLSALEAAILVWEAGSMSVPWEERLLPEIERIIERSQNAYNQYWPLVALPDADFDAYMAQMAEDAD